MIPLQANGVLSSTGMSASVFPSAGEVHNLSRRNALAAVHSDPVSLPATGCGNRRWQRILRVCNAQMASLSLFASVAVRDLARAPYDPSSVLPSPCADYSPQHPSHPDLIEIPSPFRPEQTTRDPTLHRVVTPQRPSDSQHRLIGAARPHSVRGTSNLRKGTLVPISAVTINFAPSTNLPIFRMSTGPRRGSRPQSMRYTWG